MEWLSAMFKGIGDTFTAGASVHKAQIESRTNAENLKMERDILDNETQKAQFDYLNQQAKNNFAAQAMIVAAIVIFIVVATIYGKK